MKKLEFDVSARLSFDRKFLWSTLSAREQQVALLAAHGKRTREITQELSLSSHTIETHLKHAYSKLEVRSRVELANCWQVISTSIILCAADRVIVRLINLFRLLIWRQPHPKK